MGNIDVATNFLLILYYPGAVDLNSAKGPVTPYLRIIDGLNTHDASYELAMAGGVTSAQVLPGSSNAIGSCIIRFSFYNLESNSRVLQAVKHL
jgi:imidazolonepropionase-like amidohydrolase